MVFHDWDSVLSAGDPNAKAKAYQETAVGAVDTFFPLRTVRRKSTDPIWLDKKTKKMIQDRKRLYVEEGGRTAVWKEEKKRTDEAVKKRKRGLLDIQIEKLLDGDASRHFYRHVKSFGQAEKPKLFDVRDLMPKNHSVASRIRRFKKPRSTVPVDIFPHLVTQFADFLAIPLADIYNSITASKEWPVCWKKEFVTVIPKKSNPESLADLRNISCTLLESKIYESYVLDWMKLEVNLRSNQYGGVKGLGTDHLLVNLWQRVLENAEDYRAGTVITSIDYSRAFNRMGYQECLKALARNGASSPIIELIATFLTDRTMTVKVGQTQSAPRKVNGGCPQGSILGVFLFNSTIDDLEEDCLELPETRMSMRRLLAAIPSTPRGSTVRLSAPEESPIVKAPRRIRKRLDYTEELHQTVPYEKNHWTEAKWKEALALFLRFIDDGFCLSKVNFENITEPTTSIGWLIKSRRLKG